MRRLIPTQTVIVAMTAILALYPAARAVAQQGDTTQRTSPAKKKTATAATRIKVTKNATRSAGGEVAPMTRSDTTTAVVPNVPDTTMRRDTSAKPDTTIVKPDTTRAMDTTTSVQPVASDTMAARDTSTAPRPRVINTRFGTVYLGFAAGASVPSGDIYNGYNPGFSVSLPVGWDAYRLPLGLRFDLSYDRLMARSTFRNNGQTTARVTTTNGGYSTGTATTPTATSGSTGATGYSGTARIANTDASLASAMLDAKLRLPVFGSHSSTYLYALAGGGLHYFFNYAKSLALTNPAAERAKFAALHVHDSVATTAYSTASYSASGYSAVTRLGTNMGAGMQWGVGPANLFVEGRYVTVLTKDRHTNYWPILLGITWN